MRAFGVCSDTKVGKLRNIEDFNVYDVPVPVTTDPAKLRDEMEHGKRAKVLTVVFSTYQSLPAVAEAQRLGVDDFDLVICDEALVVLHQHPSSSQALGITLVVLAGAAAQRNGRRQPPVPPILVLD